MEPTPGTGPTMSAFKPSTNVVSSSAAAIRAQWAGVWMHIGPDLRRACVDQRVLVASTSQASEFVSVDWMDSLRDALYREFGCM